MFALDLLDLLIGQLISLLGHFQWLRCFFVHVLHSGPYVCFALLREAFFRVGCSHADQC